jgi:DNA-binding transcriptional MocR family regulator
MPSRKRTRQLVRRGEIEPKTGERLYRLRALADASGLSLRTVQKHAEKGLIKLKRVGPFRLPRVTESEYRKYLDMEKSDVEK